MDKFELIAGFLDGERVDAEALAAALSTEDGRQYLVDVVALREMTTARAEAAPAFSSATTRSRHWWTGRLPAAAAAILCLSGAFLGGRWSERVNTSSPVVASRTDEASARVITAPAPTTVIRFESGVDWTETKGGIRNATRIHRQPHWAACHGQHGGRADRGRRRRRRPSTGTAAASPAISIMTTAYDEKGVTTAMSARSHKADFTQYAYTGATACEVPNPALTNLRAGVEQMFAAVAERRAQTAGAGRGAITPRIAAESVDPTQPPATAGFGWKVTGTIVSATPHQVIAQIDWQRMWDRGQTVTGPKGSSRLVLHPGERVALDSLSMSPAPTGCRAVALALQVSYLAAPTGRSGNTGSYTPLGGGGGGGTGFGGGRGGGVGAGAGRGSTGGGVAAGAAGGGVFTGGSGGGGSVGGRGGVSGSSGRGLTVESGFDRATLQAITADLWLVHKRPDGTEEVQHRSIRTTAGGTPTGDGDFGFDAPPITVAGRNHLVTVRGQVQAQRGTDGTERLFVGIIRRIGIAGEGGVYTLGGLGRTVALPRPDDVVSFEIPGSTAQVLPGHEFSLRVRISK